MALNATINDNRLKTEIKTEIKTPSLDTQNYLNEYCLHLVKHNKPNCYKCR